MKKINLILALLLVLATLFTSCTPDNNGDMDGKKTLELPEDAFENTVRAGVIGSIVQTGDGSAYVNGTVPTIGPKAAKPLASATSSENNSENKHLVNILAPFAVPCTCKSQSNRKHCHA